MNSTQAPKLSQKPSKLVKRTMKGKKLRAFCRFKVALANFCFDVRLAGELGLASRRPCGLEILTTWGVSSPQTSTPTPTAIARSGPVHEVLEADVFATHGLPEPTLAGAPAAPPGPSRGARGASPHASRAVQPGRAPPQRPAARPRRARVAGRLRTETLPSSHAPRVAWGARALRREPRKSSSGGKLASDGISRLSWCM